MALSPDRLALVNGPDADGPDADGLYKAVVPLIPLTADSWPDRLAGAPPAVRAWAEKGAAKPFAAKPGSHLVLPGDNGPAAVLVGCSDPSRPWDWGGLPFALAEGTYRIDGSLAPDVANRAALGWALGAYRFEGYKAADRAPARLVWPEGADRDVVTATALSVFLARDLVNRPANHMGPAELAAAGEELAQDFGATYRVVVGDDLLKQGWPAVHAVGRASPREPRLIELEWGAP
ncbi:MAG: leucyl aminopeptidase family protein, partial [Rhodospirillales bacterium]